MCVPGAGHAQWAEVGAGISHATSAEIMKNTTETPLAETTQGTIRTATLQGRREGRSFRQHDDDSMGSECYYFKQQTSETKVHSVHS